MLQPCGRFEWERIVRRVIMPERVKFLALLLATFADGDGSRIRPGLDQAAAMAGKSKATLKRNLAILRNDFGLLEEVSRGGGGRASEYRLVVPEDLLDRLELLDPDGRRQTNSAHSDEPSRNGTRLTVVSPVFAHDPVDNSETGLIQMSPNGDHIPTELGSNNGVSDRTGLILNGTGLTQMHPHHYSYQPPKRTTPNPDPTQPSDAHEETKCEHGLSAGRKGDGTLACALCRRSTQEAS